MSDDDDEESDEHNDDANEEQDEVKMKSYNKKKYFGQANRDVKLLQTKTTYRLKPHILKVPSHIIQHIKITAQAGKQSLADSLIQGMKWKIDQKGEYLGMANHNKVSCSIDRNWKITNGQLTSKLKKNIDKTTLTFTGKITTKNQLTTHLSHSLKYWDKFKVKYSLEGEHKKGNMSGTVGLNLITKHHLNSITWAPFLSSYSDEWGGKVSLKSNLQFKPEIYYKGHFITTENHRLYIEHKLAYGNTIANTLTLNCQDSLGILTFNSSLYLEDWTIKSKEMRILMEFKKMYRFGVQKRNEDYELMFERFKIKSTLLKAIQFHIGNGGLMTTLEGKIKPLAKCDYKLQLKLKPQLNFYHTARIGFALKFNL